MGIELLARIIIKLFELDLENKALVKEARSRRTQADRWRKKYIALEEKYKLQGVRTKEEEKVLEDVRMNKFAEEKEDS